MVGATILFDPLPVGRIGIRRKDDEVVVASDFSTFAWMIEEFVALGATTILLRSSAPEAALLSEMPPLLRRRIRLAEDAGEQRAVAQIMKPIHEEVGCQIIEGGTGLSFEPQIEPTLRSAVIRVHHDLSALAIGLNHAAQVAINPSSLTSSLSHLRSALRDDRGRAVASQVSGVLGGYASVQFDAPQIASVAPKELISIFDRLINDDSYLEFSSSVISLGHTNRRAALAQIRSCVRRMVDSPLISTIIDTASKTVKVGGAAALPKVSSLFSMLQIRALPTLVDVSAARSRALNRWLAMEPSAPPLSRSGRQIGAKTIAWLRPLQSASAREPGDPYVSMGTAGDLRRSLEEFEPDCSLRPKARTRIGSSLSRKMVD